MEIGSQLWGCSECRRLRTGWPQGQHRLVVPLLRGSGAPVRWELEVPPHSDTIRQKHVGERLNAPLQVVALGHPEIATHNVNVNRAAMRCCCDPPAALNVPPHSEATKARWSAPRCSRSILNAPLKVVVRGHHWQVLRNV